MRAYEQQYLAERGFDVRAKQKSYTINENLLGLTLSGGEIDRWRRHGDRPTEISIALLHRGVQPLAGLERLGVRAR